MLQECGGQFERLLDDRTVMQNTSLLFGMPQEPYARLDAAYAEYECMRLVYDLYARQRDARDAWSKTLWLELNPQLLLEGMEGFLRRYKQLPRACRAVPVAAALEATMKKFKNSVPLFIELKNDAMRDEHWRKLMDQTGERHAFLRTSFFSDSERQRQLFVRV